jgi:uncharacterized protein YdiU (UPF0061 family)
MMNKRTDMQTIDTLEALAAKADYSLMDTLTPNPDAREDGIDHAPREVRSGHYVPVKPTPLPDPEYVAHSKPFFAELGLDDALAYSEAFMRIFSGNLSDVPAPMRPIGWATGYALSIYGTEYYQQCPFGTGNGYGDGRAVSILEVIINGKRWEMQLKGGGQTPYCRGADGRAVLRSSIREFLAQEHMHALGIPTSRSLTLYVSQSERVMRPWFREESRSRDPEVMISEPAAITTRVASSFLRVGQIELFGRRARKQEHPRAREELEAIVSYLIEREYSDTIDSPLPFGKKILALVEAFAHRLSTLVAEWIRVGYCQGNFNSDNCAAGGFTLDYGPFGFIDRFDPRYQPWTGGGEHFSFLNQPQAALRNFHSFCTAVAPLIHKDPEALTQLESLANSFSTLMQQKKEQMWAAKLGLPHYDAALFDELVTLMIRTGVDYTLFFRELSSLPQSVEPLQKSFYTTLSEDDPLLDQWTQWLQRWRDLIDISTPQSREALIEQMKQTNPKYTLREWIVVPAYKAAEKGDYSLIHELMEVMTDPYAEHSKEIEQKYYRRKPAELFDIAGVSHVSCSS